MDLAGRLFCCVRRRAVRTIRRPSTTTSRFRRGARGDCVAPDRVRLRIASPIALPSASPTIATIASSTCSRSVASRAASQSSHCDQCSGCDAAAGVIGGGRLTAPRRRSGSGSGSGSYRRRSIGSGGGVYVSGGCASKYAIAPGFFRVARRCHCSPCCSFDLGDGAGMNSPGAAAADFQDGRVILPR